MSEEGGFYWVRYRDDLPPSEDDWTIGRFGNDAFYGKPGWMIIGSEVPYSADQVEVGQRVRPREAT